MQQLAQNHPSRTCCTGKLASVAPQPAVTWAHPEGEQLKPETSLLSRPAGHQLPCTLAFWQRCGCQGAAQQPRQLRSCCPVGIPSASAFFTQVFSVWQAARGTFLLPGCTTDPGSHLGLSNPCDKQAQECAVTKLWPPKGTLRLRARAAPLQPASREAGEGGQCLRAAGQRWPCQQVSWTGCSAHAAAAPFRKPAATTA